MQHFDVVVFDVDGTLLDTSEGVLASVKYTIKEHNLPEIDEEVLKTFIGPPIQNSFSKVYGLKGDILQELATTFRNQYKDVDLLKAVPYEGIYSVFEALIKKVKKLQLQHINDRIMLRKLCITSVLINIQILFMEQITKIN